MAEHHGAYGVDGGIAGPEQPAGRGTQAERVEVAVRHNLERRAPPVVADRHGPCGPSGSEHDADRRQPVPQRADLIRRQQGRADVDQPVRLGHPGGRQQDRREHAEHRDVDRDPQRQRERAHRDETGSARQAAGRVAHVVEEGNSTAPPVRRSADSVLLTRRPSRALLLDLEGLQSDRRRIEPQVYVVEPADGLSRDGVDPDAQQRGPRSGRNHDVVRVDRQPGVAEVGDRVRPGSRERRRRNTRRP